jgi:hypothetical protein
MIPRRFGWFMAALALRCRGGSRPCGEPRACQVGGMTQPRSGRCHLARCESSPANNACSKVAEVAIGWEGLLAKKRRTFVKDQCGAPTTCAPCRWERPYREKQSGKEALLRQLSTGAGRAPGSTAGNAMPVSAAGIEYQDAVFRSAADLIR